MAVIAGGAILLPSLALLFRLVLRGRLDPGTEHELRPPAPPAVLAASRTGLLTRASWACLLAGFGLLTVADASWAHMIGVISLLAFTVLGFFAARPDEAARHQTSASNKGTHH